MNLLYTPRPSLSPFDARSAYEPSRLGTIIDSFCEDQSLNEESLQSNCYQKSHPIAFSPTLYSGYQIPRLARTPWERERRRRRTGYKQTIWEEPFPDRFFRDLPNEVYDCILQQLEQLHLNGRQSCSSCYLRDLSNLSLTSFAWHQATTYQMYEKVWVLGSDDHYPFSQLRIRGTKKLKLLRRTLRESKKLAEHVRELQLSDFQALYQNATIEREEISDLVASLVMACPNLERLVGFHVPYTHTFDRLSHALSLKPHLKERVWYFAQNDFEGIEGEGDDYDQDYYLTATDPTERYLDLNAHQTELTTLVLHQEMSDNAINLTFRSIIGVTRQFTSLRHLSLSGFSSKTFTNLALSSLPKDLESLRLDSLPGLNDKGLQKYFTSSAAASLKQLVLIDLDIMQLSTIALLMSPYFTQLQRLSLAQEGDVHVSSNESMLEFQSSTLQYIHWEIRSQVGPPPNLYAPFASPNYRRFPFQNDEPMSCLATTVLASGIRNGQFPSLRKIRVPHDPQGVLQALCKPQSSALLPSDASIFTAAPRSSTSTTPTISNFSDSDYDESYKPEDCDPMRKDSMVSLPHDAVTLMSRPRSLAPSITSLTPSRSRLAAQSRILTARNDPFIELHISDTHGTKHFSKTLPAFLGDVASKIVYDLVPDRDLAVDASPWEMWDEEEEVNAWIAGVGDVMGFWHCAGRGMGSCRHAGTGRVGRRVTEVMDLF